MKKPDLAELDQRFLWHPFTQMQDWLRQKPTVIVAGRGAEIIDAQGKAYLDANASIWTNLHGHNHPRINAAIQAQLRKIAHSSALGLANEPASLLGERLVELAQPARRGCRLRGPRLERVFYSDNGSTALEVALKMAYETVRRSGRRAKPRFLSIQGAYHGDTVGAVSLGHIDLFHRAYQGLLFRSDAVPAPFCYRCPFNRAQPERADARTYRQCNWECVDAVEARFARAARSGRAYDVFAYEPLMQGAAGMVPQPPGWLARTAEIARGQGALLVADEIMTGFGRTGASSGAQGDDSQRLAPPTDVLFASHHEGVQPDFLCLAKGLTGGYLPMAATLTSKRVFDAFLGKYEDFRTFFHGHSYTGNQLGSAAALASLEVLTSPASRQSRQALEGELRKSLANLWDLPHVGDIRQVGLVAGVELVRDWRTRAAFDWRERVGIRVCEAMKERGVITRPVGNVIVLLPPYCTTPRQAQRIVAVLREAIEVALGELPRTPRVPALARTVPPRGKALRRQT